MPEPAECITGLFIWETVGAVIHSFEPIVRLEHGNLIVYMSQQSYDELLAIEDDDARYRRFCELLVDDILAYELAHTIPTMMPDRSKEYNIGIRTSGTDQDPSVEDNHETK